MRKQNIILSCCVFVTLHKCTVYKKEQRKDMRTVDPLTEIKLPPLHYVGLLFVHGLTRAYQGGESWGV